MNDEERFKLIHECLYFMFPSSFSKWALNEDIHRFRKGEIKEDIAFLEALTDMELIYETVWREYDFNDSCEIVRNRREARVRGGKGKAGQSKDITKFIEKTVVNDRHADSNVLWSALRHRLEDEGYEVSIFIIEDGTKALSYLDDDNKEVVCKYKNFKPAVSKIKAALNKGMI